MYCRVLIVEEKVEHSVVDDRKPKEHIDKEKETSRVAREVNERERERSITTVRTRVRRYSRQPNIYDRLGR